MTSFCSQQPNYALVNHFLRNAKAFLSIWQYYFNVFEDDRGMLYIGVGL